MATATRLDILRRAVRTQGGEWTTRRVQHLYRDQGYAAPLRATARRDLAQLAGEGVLVLNVQNPARWFYTPRSDAR